MYMVQIQAVDSICLSRIKAATCWALHAFVRSCGVFCCVFSSPHPSHAKMCQPWDILDFRPWLGSALMYFRLPFLSAWDSNRTTLALAWPGRSENLFPCLSACRKQKPLCLQKAREILCAICSWKLLVGPANSANHVKPRQTLKPLLDPNYAFTIDKIAGTQCPRYFLWSAKKITWRKNMCQDRSGLHQHPSIAAHWESLRLVPSKRKMASDTTGILSSGMTFCKWQIRHFVNVSLVLPGHNNRALSKMRAKGFLCQWCFCESRWTNGWEVWKRHGNDNRLKDPGEHLSHKT